MKDADPTPVADGDVGEFGLIENVKRRSGRTLRTGEPAWSNMGLRVLSRRRNAFRRSRQSGSAKGIPVEMGIRAPLAGGIRPRNGGGSSAESSKTVRGGT